MGSIGSKSVRKISCCKSIVPAFLNVSYRHLWLVCILVYYRRLLLVIVVVDSVFFDEPLKLILLNIMWLAPWVVKQVWCLVNRLLNYIFKIFSSPIDAWVYRPLWKLFNRGHCWRVVIAKAANSFLEVSDSFGLVALDILVCYFFGVAFVIWTPFGKFVFETLEFSFVLVKFVI